MKKSFFITTFSLLLVLGGSGCKKIMNKSVWVSYNQTGCADPWRKKASSQEELKVNIQEYFENKKGRIRIFKIEFSEQEELRSMCLACHCTTGTVIKILAKERDVNIFLKEGFYR